MINGRVHTMGPRDEVLAKLFGPQQSQQPDNLDTLGVRATSTSTAEGSIKGGCLPRASDRRQATRRSPSLATHAG